MLMISWFKAQTYHICQDIAPFLTPIPPQSELIMAIHAFPTPRPATSRKRRNALTTTTLEPYHIHNTRTLPRPSTTSPVTADSKSLTTTTSAGLRGSLRPHRASYLPSFLQRKAPAKTPPPTHETPTVASNDEQLRREAFDTFSLSAPPAYEPVEGTMAAPIPPAYESVEASMAALIPPPPPYVAVAAVAVVM